ncbi:MAG: hypothetical protein FJ145_23000 [Deltaproteobacteria bacterium]|nr:hypothetical protein [Deltaproteobacteria bacterium]
MFHKYRYEAEFYPKLSRLPLDVRRKLDVTGMKLSLKDWLAFDLEERQVLCHLPCDTEEEQLVFAEYLSFLSKKHRGSTVEKLAAMDAGVWEAGKVPAAVAQKSAELQASVSAEEWNLWPAHHRYALYKTAASKAQPEAFEQVLQQLRALRKI